jgi:hypothetical protein
LDECKASGNLLPKSGIAEGFGRTSGKLLPHSAALATRLRNREPAAIWFRGS